MMPRVHFKTMSYSLGFVISQEMIDDDEFYGTPDDLDDCKNMTQLFGDTWRPKYDR